jgi:hypothetical protein
MTDCRTRKPVTGVVFLLVLLPLLLCQCAKHEKMAGTYHAVETGPQGNPAATLELQVDGKGLWSIETDNAPFRWDLHNNAIRLHTPSGGVIVGTIDDGTIKIDIPGSGMITFRRAK